HGERTTRAARWVEDAAQAALGELDVDGLLREVADRLRDVIGVDTATVLLPEPDGQTLTVRAAVGLEETVRRGSQVPIGRGFAGTIAADRRPRVIEQVGEVEVWSDLLRTRLASLAGVPMELEGRLIGVVHVGSLEPRHFTDDELRLLRLAADRM